MDKIKTKDEINALCYRATVLDDAEAQYLLGRHFYVGDSEYIAEDKAKAVEWCIKAAEQGHVIAQCSLAHCYYNGNGIAKDKAKAVEWYTKAAEQGYADAQYRLANCYYRGNGVDKDILKAKYLYSKVEPSSGFYKDAQEKLKLIETEIAVMNRTKVFISYSHRDEKYFDELVGFLKSLKFAGIEIWHDKMIQPGDKWREEIREYMSKTKVAILMMSNAFLTSDFVRNEELPELLRAAEEEQATIMWIPVGPYIESSAVITGENGDRIDITEYQAVCAPKRSLKSISDEHERDTIYVKLCNDIERCFKKEKVGVE